MDISWVTIFLTMDCWWKTRCIRFQEMKLTTDREEIVSTCRCIFLHLNSFFFKKKSHWFFILLVIIKKLVHEVKFTKLICFFNYKKRLKF